MAEHFNEASNDANQSSNLEVKSQKSRKLIVDASLEQNNENELSFNNLSSALQNAHEGDIVFLQEGEYVVKGEDLDLTCIKLVGSSSNSCRLFVDSITLHGRDDAGCTLSNLFIEYTQDFIVMCGRHLIENCIIYSLPEILSIRMCHSKVTLQANHFIGCSLSVSEFSTTQIIGNTFYASYLRSRCDFAIQTNNSNCIIRGNTISSSNVGIWVNTGSALIEENLIEECCFSGMQMTNSTEVTFRNNKVRACLMGICGAGVKLEVTNCEFSHTIGPAICLSGMSQTPVVKGNKFSDGRTYGIRFQLKSKESKCIPQLEQENSFSGFALGTVAGKLNEPADAALRVMSQLQINRIFRLDNLQPQQAQKIREDLAPLQDIFNVTKTHVEFRENYLLVPQNAPTTLYLDNWDSDTILVEKGTYTVSGAALFGNRKQVTIMGKNIKPILRFENGFHVKSGTRLTLKNLIIHLLKNGIVVEGAHITMENCHVLAEPSVQTHVQVSGSSVIRYNRFGVNCKRNAQVIAGTMLSLVSGSNNQVEDNHFFGADVANIAICASQAKSIKNNVILNTYCGISLPSVSASFPVLVESNFIRRCKMGILVGLFSEYNVTIRLNEIHCAVIGVSVETDGELELSQNTISKTVGPALQFRTTERMKLTLKENKLSLGKTAAIRVPNIKKLVSIVYQTVCTHYHFPSVNVEPTEFSMLMDAIELFMKESRTAKKPITFLGLAQKLSTNPIDSLQLYPLMKQNRGIFQFQMNEKGPDEIIVWAKTAFEDFPLLIPEMKKENVPSGSRSLNEIFSNFIGAEVVHLEEGDYADTDSIIPTQSVTFVGKGGKTRIFGRFTWSDPTVMVLKNMEIHLTGQIGASVTSGKLIAENCKFVTSSIFVAGGASLVLKGNTFVDSQSGQELSMPNLVLFGNAEIEGNTFSGNMISIPISVADQGEVTIKGNTFSKARAAVLLKGGKQTVLQDNVFQNCRKAIQVAGQTNFRMHKNKITHVVVGLSVEANCDMEVTENEFINSVGPAVQFLHVDHNLKLTMKKNMLNNGKTFGVRIPDTRKIISIVEKYNTITNFPQGQISVGLNDNTFMVDFMEILMVNDKKVLTEKFVVNDLVTALKEKGYTVQQEAVVKVLKSFPSIFKLAGELVLWSKDLYNFPGTLEYFSSNRESFQTEISTSGEIEHTSK